MATKTNLKTRLQDASSTLSISLRQGKNAFNVSFTLKESGGKPQTGGRSSHEKLEDATAAYNALVSDATGKGWKPRESKVGAGLAAIPVAKKREDDRSAPAKTATPAAKK